MAIFKSRQQFALGPASVREFFYLACNYSGNAVALGKGKDLRPLRFLAAAGLLFIEPAGKQIDKILF